MAPESFLVVDTKDLRLGQRLYPLGLSIWEDLCNFEQLALKEIVMLVPEGKTPPKLGERKEAKDIFLNITHRYLMIYRIRHRRGQSKA